MSDPRKSGGKKKPSTKRRGKSQGRSWLVAGTVGGMAFMLAVVVTAAAIFWPQPETRVPATPSEIAALEFSYLQPPAFRPYNAGEKSVLLQAAAGDQQAIHPTVEIYVDLKLASHDFSPEKLVLDRWPELGALENFTMMAPRGEWFVGEQGIVLAGTTTDTRTGDLVHVEQWVSKQETGYARLVAFAPEARFNELKPEIYRIARSISIK